MKFAHLIFGLLVISSTIAAAQSTKSAKAQAAKSAVATMNWQGTYFGITDCANCEGIETRLQLNENKTYVLSVKPTKTKEKEFVQKGSFKWQGDMVVLQDLKVAGMAYMYKVEKNQVRQLYLISGEIRGADWKGYILKKVGAVR
ncbi:copper resistance protein NlpE [Flavobacterium sp.]|uniref:copper resistance protein NlpE n=1 Tax=Flavobacterium sp. TaxID=239 RepID=UPI001223A996|nr:copper resistance protein NlpE [Flavobacterium sp.]RZJ72566.1 MAG: copper resistance protein NlpE [Flavobacterium sp.]